MDLIIAFSITFILLVLSACKGIFLAYPLTVAILLFFIIAIRRGFAYKDVLSMVYRGGKKSFVMAWIFILIGALIPIWTAAGTIPAIVYYGTELIKPELFILCVFLISCSVSLLIGTATGTTGIVGVAMMVMARSGNVNLAATAGAIIAGSYFGDRCSPVSSSASFVACITETRLYDNIKSMFKTAAVPFIIAAVFYLEVSGAFPLHSSSGSINRLILQQFSISLVVLAPAFVILIFSVLKVNVKISMLVSIASALAASILVQHKSIWLCIKFMIFGFRLDTSNPLYSIIKGGGIISMTKSALVVFLATAFAGMVEETNILQSIEGLTSRAESREEVYRNVVITSFFGSMVGCSQTFSVMLTYMLNKKAYDKNRLDNSIAAVDLANTAIMVSALVPWNVALVAQMSILNVNASFLPYLMYIYIVPLWNLFYLYIKKRIIDIYKANIPV